MKFCIMQPPYSKDLTLSDELFQYKLDLLDRCDDTVDVIVLPEYSDVPCATTTAQDTFFYHERYIDKLLKKCIDTAKRCKATVFVNALCRKGDRYRNTTYVYNRDGQQIGAYYKNHLPPSEKELLQLDDAYADQYTEPYVIELEGIRYGFLTCYDFYFYEGFSNIARCNVDVMIGCSLQRSDSHAAIETLCRFLAYNTNAYVVRSSVSFAEDAEVCGASMVVSPKSEVLLNMRGKFGMETIELDPKDKYYKAAGYGGKETSHYAYIEYGRKPWLYRNAGPSVVLPEADMKYPRVCAHRGFNTIAPENSMPAFGAAVAMGAEEIEFDLRSTKDGVLVVCHDDTIDTVSNGHGRLCDYTYRELLQFDFGISYGPKFAGLKIPTFEEILQKFAGRVIMNIHVKLWDHHAPAPMIEEILGLVRKYDAEKHIYFMTSCDEMIRRVMEYAPDIRCCVGWDGNPDPMSMVDRAIALNACKIQLFKPYFDQNTINKAHAHGIRCNVFWSDDRDETKKFLEMGIDTILTNDYNLISQVVKG